MRIGMITGEYPPQPGGVGDFTRQLARALATAGHSVHVLTSRLASAAPADRGVAVEPVIARWGWRSLLAARRWAAAQSLDVVNVQYQAAMYGLSAPIHFLPEVIGRPTVATFHDLRIPYLFPKAGPLRDAAVTHLARSACAAIATDPADAETLRRRGVGVVRQIPIGSNVAPQPPPDYDRGVWRAAHGFAADDFLIGYFGFLNSSKGGDTLIEALARLVGRGAPAHLILIGGSAGASDPTDLAFGEQLAARIRAHGLTDRVTRTGYLPEAETSAALLACDVMALPYRDGASLRRGTLMAALAHGLPIVSTLGPQTVEELRGGEALRLVPTDLPEPLVDALEALRVDAEARARLAVGARTLAARYDWVSIAAQTARVLEACRAGKMGSL